MKALRQMGGTCPWSKITWNKNASGWQRDGQAFLKKVGGMPSGPPAERWFNLFMMRETKVGVKTMEERPGPTERGCMPGCTPLSLVNCDWKNFDNKLALT